MNAASSYPIHDKDGYLEFILGMCFNTRETHGKPTGIEVEIVTADWPAPRRSQLLAILRARGQLA